MSTQLRSEFGEMTDLFFENKPFKKRSLNLTRSRVRKVGDMDLVWDFMVKDSTDGQFCSTDCFEINLSWEGYQSKERIEYFVDFYLFHVVFELSWLFFDFFNEGELGDVYFVRF